VLLHTKEAGANSLAIYAISPLIYVNAVRSPGCLSVQVAVPSSFGFLNYTLTHLQLASAGGA